MWSAFTFRLGLVTPVWLTRMFEWDRATHCGETLDPGIHMNVKGHKYLSLGLGLTRDLFQLVSIYSTNSLRHQLHMLNLNLIQASGSQVKHAGWTYLSSCNLAGVS